MTYKSYWISSLLLFLSLRLFAFQPTENVIIRKIDSLNTLSWETKQADIAKSLLLAKEAASLSSQISYTKGQQYAIKNLAVLDIFKGNYDSALIKANQFLELTIERKDTAEMANAYNVTGSIYYYKGELELGIKNYLQSLKLKEFLGDLKGTAKLYNNISTIYIGQEKFAKSIEYNLKSIKIKRQLNDSIGLSNSYNNIGFSYRELAMYDSALYYSSLGLKMILPTQNELLKSSLYSNTADIYLKMNVLDSALYMFTKSIEISTKLQENRTIIYAYLGVGKVYVAKNRIKQALPYLQKGKELALSIGAKKEIADSFSELSKAFAALNRYKEAYLNHLSYEIYKDSIINEKNNKDIEELERTYKYEKQQNQIHQFEIENAFQKETFEKQRKIGLGLMVLLLIMGALAYFLIKNNKAKRIAIDELELKNEEIKKHQKNIQDQNELLAAKNKKLLQLDEEKNHLVSIVAHDLRSPLANIMGLIGILDLDGNLNEKQKGFIEKINQSAEKLNEMISKVLSKDNVKQAELEIELKPLSANDLINKSIESLQQNALQKNIKILFNKIANLPLIMADANFGLQVLSNLVSNAIKFSLPKKNIFINTYVEDSLLYVSIKDEGPGFTDEDQKNLFGRYQRLSAKPTAGESSTGLGLSIVKEYMELMGGTIECNSSEGEGAEFIIGFKLA